MFILIAIIVLFIALLVTLRFIYEKQSVPSISFSIALENENNGNYEVALNNYEIALTEVKKTNRNKELRIKILEKIKVLHTVINYEKGI